MGQYGSISDLRAAAAVGPGGDVSFSLSFPRVSPSLPYNDLIISN